MRNISWQKDKSRDGTSTRRFRENDVTQHAKCTEWRYSRHREAEFETQRWPGESVRKEAKRDETRRDETRNGMSELTRW